MASKAGSKKVAGTHRIGPSASENIQIKPYRNGYLIKGDIDQSHAALQEFATWNEQLGAWYITRRSAYEYDHHYGLHLFSQ